jgi:hypothetical protein
VCFGGKVYVFGGYDRDIVNSKDIILNSCEMYDPVEEVWSEI